MRLVKQNNPNPGLVALPNQNGSHLEAFTTQLFTDALAAPPDRVITPGRAFRSAPSGGANPATTAGPGVIRYWHPGISVITYGPTPQNLRSLIPPRTFFAVHIHTTQAGDGRFRTEYPRLNGGEPSAFRATSGPWRPEFTTAWRTHLAQLQKDRRKKQPPPYAQLIESLCPDGYQEAFVRAWTNGANQREAPDIRFWLCVLYLTKTGALNAPAGVSGRGAGGTSPPEPGGIVSLGNLASVAGELKGQTQRLFKILSVGRPGTFAIGPLELRLNEFSGRLLQAFLQPVRPLGHLVSELPVNLVELGDSAFFSRQPEQWGLGPNVFARVHAVLSASRKSDGVFYTPGFIARYMAAQGVTKKKERVLDPSCGGGVFLQAARERTNAQHIEGWDIDPTAIDYCQALLADSSQLSIRNAIDLTTPVSSSDAFDLILSNPPYDILNRKDDPQIDPQLWPKLKKVYPWNLAAGGKKNLYQLFIARMLSLLAMDGRLKVICPMGILADRSAERLRREILENFRLERIDVFPERDNRDARIFSDAKMSVCILHIRRTKGLGKIPVFVYTKQHGLWKAKRVTVHKKTITDIDSSGRPIPIVSPKDGPYLAKAAAHPRRMQQLGRVYEGELNMTFHKHLFRPLNMAAPKLPSGELAVIKGAAIQRYQITAQMSQGQPVQASIASVNGAVPKKAGLCKIGRIAMQGITGINEEVRLKMTWLPPGFYLANSTNYIIPTGGTDPFTLLGLLNSRAANWYFRLLSTNSNVNTYELHRLPVPALSCARQLAAATYALWLCRATQPGSLFTHPAFAHHLKAPNENRASQQSWAADVSPPQPTSAASAAPSPQSSLAWDIPEADLLEEYIEAMVWEAYFPQPFHTCYGPLAAVTKSPAGFTQWQIQARRKSGQGAIGTQPGFFRRAMGPVELFA